METTRSRVSRLVASALVASACACASPPMHDVPRAPAAAPSAAPPPDAAAAMADPLPPPGIRLATTVRPTHEGLELTIDPSQERYSGIATIDLTLTEASDTVWLHAVDLEITGAEARVAGKVLPLRVVPGTFGRIGVHAREALPVGASTLAVTFRGTLDSVRSRGIYREREGATPYVYTFFEAVDARRGFPCFDEPSFKIPWTLSFHVAPGDVVAANTEMRTTTAEEGGRTLVRFATSKPLPSYLVAFIVGPFDVVPLKSGPTRPIRIFAPKGRAAETRFAQEITADLVKILEAQIGVPYPYEKLDVAVVPRYWGTMEHPGLVALGQPLTLMTKVEETFGRKTKYARIAIHELAHYWFGDMVTTAWWDDTWLNESFASWADGKATTTFAPTWGMPSERLRNKQLAIASDVLPTAKPVRLPVVHDTDITAAFDTTSTYYKGAAVLAMLEQWAGADRFRDTIAAYLRAHEGGVATMDDMARAIASGLGPDAADVLHAFIERPGVPVVSMALTCEPAKAPRLHVTQERLASEASATAPWPIPVCLRYGSGGSGGTAKETHRACHLLREREADLPLEGASCPQWLVGQEAGVGYYVVSYETSLASRLFAKASGATLNERLAAAYDSRTLERTGHAAASDTLALLEPLAQTGAADALRFVAEALDTSAGYADDADRDLLAAYVRRVFEPLRARIGFTPPQDPPLAMVQGKALATLAEIGRSKPTIAAATRLASTWLATHGGVDDGLVETVLTLAVGSGDAALYARVRAAALAPSTPREDKRRLFVALGATPDPKLAADALSRLLDPKVDLREGRVLVTSALDSANPSVTRELAFDFMLTHMAEITARMRDDDASQTLRVANTFCDDVHADRAEKALGDLAARIDGGTLALHQSVERARGCAKTRAARASALHAFLRTVAK